MIMESWFGRNIIAGFKNDVKLSKQVRSPKTELQPLDRHAVLHCSVPNDCPISSAGWRCIMTHRKSLYNQVCFSP